MGSASQTCRDLYLPLGDVWDDAVARRGCVVARPLTDVEDAQLTVDDELRSRDSNVRPRVSNCAAGRQPCSSGFESCLRTLALCRDVTKLLQQLRHEFQCCPRRWPCTRARGWRPLARRLTCFGWLALARPSFRPCPCGRARHGRESEKGHSVRERNEHAQHARAHSTSVACVRIRNGWDHPVRVRRRRERTEDSCKGREDALWADETEARRRDRGQGQPRPAPRAASARRSKLACTLYLRSAAPRAARVLILNRARDGTKMVQCGRAGIFATIPCTRLADRRGNRPRRSRASAVGFVVASSNGL